MVKVLYFVDRMLRGGIQSLVIEWVSKFDKEKIHVDFLLLDDGKHYDDEEKLKDMGCNVYKLNGVWIRKPTDFIKYKKSVDEFFKNHHDYKVVHLHSTSKNFYILKVAKEYNIPIRVAHAHSTGFQTKNKFKIFIGNLLKKKLLKYANKYYVCSTDAGEWMFGKENLKYVKIIPNGIEIEKFKYNPTIRKKIRKQHKISNDTIVVGNVARLEQAKNHIFLLEVFKEICKVKKNYILVILGTGRLEQKLREKVQEYKLEKNVIFLGFVKDIYKYYQIMDVYVMPSIYEGFPVTAVEAQASGLPCVFSNNITKEVKINPNVEFVDLKVSKWVENLINDEMQRITEIEPKLIKQYDIKNIALELQNIYLTEDKK